MIQQHYCISAPALEYISKIFSIAYNVKQRDLISRSFICPDVEEEKINFKARASKILN